LILTEVRAWRISGTKPTVRNIAFSDAGVISFFRASEVEKAHSGAVKTGDGRNLKHME